MNQVNQSEFISINKTKIYVNVLKIVFFIHLKVQHIDRKLFYSIFYAKNLFTKRGNTTIESSVNLE